MKIKANNIQELIEDINNKMAEGAIVVVYNNLEELLKAMGLNISLIDYINISDFLKQLRNHKLFYWNKICFTTTGKDERIVFFRYLNLSRVANN